MVRSEQTAMVHDHDRHLAKEPHVLKHKRTAGRQRLGGDATPTEAPLALSRLERRRQRQGVRTPADLLILQAHLHSTLLLLFHKLPRHPVVADSGNLPSARLY